MPPKKRGRPSAESSRPKASAPSSSRRKPKDRPVDPTIRAAFQKYATPQSEAESTGLNAWQDMTISIPDVRRALKALKIPLPPPDFFEEDAEAIGWVEFSELAATLAEARDEEDGSGSDGEGSEFADEDAEDSQKEEIDEAFGMFFPRGAAPGGLKEQRITIADLKRIAKELKEDVDERTLRLMVEEANGDGSVESLRRGVGRKEFEAVMRRAGVF